MSDLRTLSDFPLNLLPYHRGELLHGYLNRVAMANDLPGMDYMQRHILDPENAGLRNFTYSYDCSGTASSIVRLEEEEKSELISEGTIFRGEAPLEDRLSSALRIYRYNLPKSYVSPITGRNKPLLREIRICPECRREEGEDWFFHTDLQMPMVKICPKHGCALQQYTGTPFKEHFEESFKPYEVTRADEPMSLFITEFFNKGFECSYTEIRNAVLHGLFEREIDCLDASPLVYPMAGMFKDILPSPYDFYHSSYFRLPEFKVFPLLTYLYEDAASLAVAIGEIPSMEDEFSAAIDGRFELLSDYRENIVTLQCSECGKTFVASPKGILIGLGCPFCNREISESELYERMVITHSHCNHIPLPFEKKNLFTINYVEKKTGEHKSSPARKYFNDDFDTEILAGKLKKEVKSKGNYELVDFTDSPSDYFIRLTIKHANCGYTFDVFRHEFLVSPYCRSCSSTRNTKSGFAHKLVNIEQSFRIVGQYFSDYVEVTNGDVTFKGLPLSVLHSVERYVRGDNPIRKASPKDESLYERAEALIEEKRGQIIPAGEFYRLGQRDRVHNCIRSLCAQKKLKTVVRGFYCHYEDNFSIEDVQKEIYVKDGDIGFPVCDSALVYIGKKRKTERPAFILKQKGPNTDLGRKELGEPNLFGIADELKKENSFNAVMFVGSVCHQRCFSSRTKAETEGNLMLLLGYALSHGTSIDEIRRTAGWFSNKTNIRVEKLIKEYEYAEKNE